MTLPEGDQRSATTRSLTKQFRDAYSFLAFASRRAGLLVRLILAIVFAFAGMDLIFHPTLGLVTLTLILATIFFLEGFAEIFAYIRPRRQPGTGWLLANGITLFLAALIWTQWPSSAVWAIGTLVGINLIMSGIAPVCFYSQNSNIQVLWPTAISTVGDGLRTMTYTSTQVERLKCPRSLSSDKSRRLPHLPTYGITTKLPCTWESLPRKPRNQVEALQSKPAPSTYGVVCRVFRFGR